MDRHGTIQEVAELVLWLSSEETHSKMKNTSIQITLMDRV
jgi:hypothetical protein